MFIFEYLIFYSCSLSYFLNKFNQMTQINNNEDLKLYLCFNKLKSMQCFIKNNYNYDDFRDELVKRISTKSYAELNEQDISEIKQCLKKYNFYDLMAHASLEYLFHKNKEIINLII